MGSSSRSKNGEIRHVRMNSRVRAILEMRKPASSAGKVFKPTSWYWFQAAVKRAGLKDFSWHCLRHTFCSRLIMSGVDIRTAQELMGHKSIVMTMRYAHLAPEHQAAAVERLVKPTGTTTDTSITREGRMPQVVQ